MSVVKDPVAINFKKMVGLPGGGESPAVVLVDVDGVPVGTVTNPIEISAVLVPTTNLSIGPNGVAVPLDSTQVGGPDAGGLLHAAGVLNVAPGGAEYGFVVRNIPSGTQTVAGNKTNNAAAPVADNVGVLPALANAATPTWTEGNQVISSVDLSGAQRVRGAQTGTATLTNVASSAVNVTLLAANTARKGVLIVNDGNKTLYVKYGATASLVSYSVLMPPSSYWEMPWPTFTGQLDGIWSAANGSARITEL